MPSWLHVAVGAALGLLLAQRVVAGGLEHEVQGARVLARVVGGAGDRLVGEVVGRDEVAPSQLGRVHVELLRQVVHGALDERGRLRAPRSAVGADRRRVGDHAAKAEVHARDHVDARGHLAGEEGHDHRVAGIGAAVGEHVDADADQGPVAARAQLDVLDLRAPVLHRDHRLPAALDVAHRLAQAQRRRGYRGLLGIGGDPRAEAAADVGHRHVDGVLLQAQRSPRRRRARCGAPAAAPRCARRPTPDRARPRWPTAPWARRPGAG